MEICMMDSKIAEILEGFRNFNAVYQRDLVDAAVERKDEITPCLIEVLENLLSDPGKYIENPDLFDHTYAVMLLGHFREPGAHKVIVDLFSIPGRLSHDLFGDIVTEDLPMILLRTCNGSLDRIKSLALNKSADDYCRSSALHAMAYAVLEGIVSREEVLAFYGNLFNGDEASEDSDFWGLLACLVNDLYPEELMDTIRRAFEDGVINPGMIGYPSFERNLERGRESCLREFRKDFERNSLDNLHARMSWWACFNPEPKAALPIPYPAVHPPASRTLNKKQKKDQKKKKNMAKASRRKNRR
jgi:hypothetical protein